MFIICPDCQGRKTIEVLVPDSKGNMGFETRTCFSCHGVGEVYDPNSRLGDDTDKSAG